MSFWRNLKIGVKIYVGFAAVLAILIGLGLFAISNFAVINDQSTEMATNWLPSIVYVETLNTAAGDFRTAQGTNLIAQSDADIIPLPRDVDGAKHR